MAKRKTVSRLVRFAEEIDKWLEREARDKSKERGATVTVQDVVREIVSKEKAQIEN